MTRWILAATAAVALGAIGGGTARATDYNDVQRAQRHAQDEWQDYQQAMCNGRSPSHVRKEYRDWVRAQQRVNRTTARYYGSYPMSYGTYYAPGTYYGTTTYYAQPYPVQTYYYAYPRTYVATRPGVVIWR